MGERTLHVEVRPYSEDESDPGYERRGPFDPAEAARVDAFLNWNLNHERYYTRIVSGHSHWRSERSIAEQRENGPAAHLYPSAGGRP